jgi:galactitol-specific phosphotransferase system IIC component
MRVDLYTYWHIIFAYSLNSYYEGDNLGATSRSETMMLCMIFIVVNKGTRKDLA